MPDSTADEAPAIAVENLGITYDDGTVAVDGLSLTVPRGECFGFLGPNGAGKTTTISVLTTLLAPTTGTARVNGYDVQTTQTAVRATVGYMAQSVSIDGELTARENLRFACDAYGVPAGDRADRIDELLELVDLADVGDKPAEQFSGGMKKRLDAATALVHEPQLVFLDEPTTGLDPKARNRLWTYFDRINEQGTTIFLTTQYLQEADELCDRLAVLRDGSIVTRGSPAELKRRVGGDVLVIDIDGDSQTAAAILRKQDLLDADSSIEPTERGLRIRMQDASDRGTDLFIALEAADISVAGFSVEEATLDDVFLSIADADGEKLDEPDQEAVA